MHWLDVFGPPGVGKSALCDAAWPPRCIAPDGEPPPLAWSAFLAVATRLLVKVQRHPSGSACHSMFHRSLAKMATVSRKSALGCYVQTGFAQRGLGIGWRLQNPEDIRPYFAAMPISRGVVLLTAPLEEIRRRNVARYKDRSFMVPLMARTLEIAREVLAARGALCEVIDTTQPIDVCRRQLAYWADMP